MSIQKEIEALANLSFDELQKNKQSRDVFHAFKQALNKGEIRSAEKRGENWEVNLWVKKGILLGFKLGKLVDFSDPPFTFFDKDTYPTKSFLLESNVRIVPGGSSVRDGAYVAPSVVIMPPAYINVGSYVDSGTMIDSHALVGSCAQIGKNVHLSAASQIGGVLEPIGAMPVIIEDHVMIGGNCGIYEGTIVQKNCVIGTGVILNGSIPVYDLVREQVLRKTESTPLIIPEGAVVIAGSRAITKNEFARKEGLSIYTPIIIKYRDEKTNQSVNLEDLLR